jgi:pimeloyl-ACP methyl ester carboxylesterase
MRRWCTNAREVVVGDGGVTVVLAHGYGVTQASWDKILPSISKADKVILFDWDFTSGAGVDDEEEERYTFGRFADDLISLMDERQVRGAVFVGHSMSAMVGCIASARRPDLFAHLVLLCASPRYVRPVPAMNHEELSSTAGDACRHPASVNLILVVNLPARGHHLSAYMSSSAIVHALVGRSRSPYATGKSIHRPRLYPVEPNVISG